MVGVSIVDSELDRRVEFDSGATPLHVEGHRVTHSRNNEKGLGAEFSRADRTKESIDTAFRVGAIRGTAIAKLLPRTSGFSADGDHRGRKQRVEEKFGAHFERLFGLSSWGTHE